MSFAYLGALLLSLGGLALLDRRFRLAFWSDPRRAALTVGIGVVGFLLWDGIGLVLGIFARGDSPAHDRAAAGARAAGRGGVLPGAALLHRAARVAVVRPSACSARRGAGPSTTVTR